MRNVLEKLRKENQIHFVSNNAPPPKKKSFRFRDNVEKFGTVWQATDNNTAHEYYVLDT